MAECGARVGGGTITFPCSLDKEHDGPCLAVENARSVSQRSRWLAEQSQAEEARRVLASHQGRPMTFAENVGEGPGTPVPGSNLQPAEYRAANPGSASPPGPKVATVEYARNADGSVTPLPGVEVAPPEDPIEVSEQSAHEERKEGWASEPTKQREGDQPLPEVNDSESIQSLLIRDIEDRIKVGIERYGTPLQAFNGRDSMLDAYEEAVDQATYLKQVMVERAGMAAVLRRIEQWQTTGEPLPNDLFQGLLEVAEWLEK